MITYITKEIVIQTNKGLVSSYGQSYARLQEANLDHVLDRMRHYGEDIKDEKEKILKKAAYLLFHLAYDFHVFSDGNKRTALTSTLYFLISNSYGFSPEINSQEKQEELARTIKEIAEGKHSLSQVYQWLKKNIIRVGMEPAPAKGL